jgi:hypothetical protein
MVWFVFAVLSCAVGEDRPAPPKQPALREELLRMMKVDQEARFKIVELMKKRSLQNPNDVRAGLTSEELKEVNEIDARNLQRMKEIIAQHGWPGLALVGKDGAGAAWLLVQHGDTDRAFQQKCLELMKAAPPGDVEKRHIAYLTDRVLVGQKKKQVYGTQLDGKGNPLPLEEPEKVDERRAALGMEPLAEYLKQARKMYGVKEEEKKK